MAVINLRNVSDELVLELKQEALRLKMGFHEYCSALLLSRGRVDLTSNYPFPGKGAAQPDRRPVFEIDSPAAKRYVARVLAQQQATIPIEDEPIRETTYEPLLD